METLCKSFDYSENHSIIGDEDQLLQILLYRFDSFITKREFLNYFSSNLETKDVNHQSLRKAERNGLIELNNNTSLICYVGLYGCGGKKIIKIRKIIKNIIRIIH